MSPKSKKLEKIKKKIVYKRKVEALKCQSNFWLYCKRVDPEFYTEDKPHLKELCNLLQAFWEGQLTDEQGKEFLRLMINMPRRHGKTRTLTNFVPWVLGNNNDIKVLVGAYNDPTAQDISKYTRDNIEEEKNLPFQWTFSDIFPDTKLKQGSSAYEKWALEGQHFNYIGTGIRGTATGKGTDLILIDDVIKNKYEAYNKNYLDRVWDWYNNTLTQTKEKGAKVIINITRWSKGDICGRILGEYEDATKDDSYEQADKWYHYVRKAKEDGEMLCPAVMDESDFEDKKEDMDKEIFYANYQQETLENKGKLYKSFQTYSIIPLNKNGAPDFDYIANYTDVADQGDDFLSSVTAGVKVLGDEVLRYPVDVYYTDKLMDDTEEELASRFYQVWKDYGFPVEAVIESNNGGRSFARAIRRELNNMFTTKCVELRWKHQSDNKMGRILSNKKEVMENVYFPDTWKEDYPNFYMAMTRFTRKNNEHDDAPDSVTGLVEITDNDNRRITAGVKL